MSGHESGISHDGRGRGSRTHRKAREIEADALSLLEHRAYVTYRARLRTANRMRVRGQLWNLPLVTSPVITLIVAIVASAAPGVYSDRTDVLLVALSVLTLVASIIVPTANYAVNAERLFNAYRDLQRISVEIEGDNLRLKNGWSRNRAASRASTQYQEILDKTQNHSSADYWGVVRDQNHNDRRKGNTPQQIPFSARVQLFASWSLTALPVAIAVLLLPLLLPAIRWMINA
ncbi:SLATT domain-containing protein [Microbacterium sp. NPDC089696]|uniref:SLATT domain-containing protein n=1 Tax=Microbacterium sp. NPDC089696 TaxID=3364199 RepID=UPI00382F48D5